MGQLFNFAVNNTNNILSRVSPQSATTLITSSFIKIIQQELFNFEAAPIESADFRSILDTPVIDRLEFPAGRWFTQDDIKRERPIDYGGFHMDSIILTVTQTKNIVKTSISGRDGTVKEYISKGDYIITGKGFITDKYQILPSLELIEFKKMTDAPVSIKVNSEFLNEIMEIFNIVIEKFTYKQMRGFRNQIEVNFEASSDFAIGFEEIVIE